VNADFKTGVITQKPPERMPNSVKDEVVEALKNAADEFYDCGGRHPSGLEAFDSNIPGSKPHIPGYNDFCKLYRI
jgi:hypothetical protein